MDEVPDETTGNADITNNDQAHEFKHVYALSMDKGVALHGDGIAEILKIAGKIPEENEEIIIPILSEEEVKQVRTVP